MISVMFLNVFRDAAVQSSVIDRNTCFGLFIWRFYLNDNISLEEKQKLNEFRIRLNICAIIHLYFTRTIARNYRTFCVQQLFVLSLKYKHDAVSSKCQVRSILQNLSESKFASEFCKTRKLLLFRIYNDGRRSL